MKAPISFQRRGFSPMKPSLAQQFLGVLLLACLGGGFDPSIRASEPSPLEIKAVALVCGDGIFLPQIVDSDQPLPAVRLGDAPAFGKNVVFTRAQLAELIANAASAVGTNFSGAETVKISRRTRTLGESDILGLLTATLQHKYIKDRGQLELQLAQTWKALVLPDEPLTVEITDLPSLGVTPSFMVRFSLRTERETLGTWSAGLKAHVWREVLVANEPLNRGDMVNLQQFSRERRDILTLREALTELGDDVSALEFVESVPAGMPLLARMVKPRNVIHRGQRADALVQDGAMSIKTRVDVLEDGAPGQTVRARNSITHRDLTGKVLDERTILISL